MPTKKASIRTAEVGKEKTVSAFVKRVLRPASGRGSAPVKAALEAVRTANPDLDLGKLERLPEGTVIVIPEVAGAEPVAEETRPVSKVPVAAVKDARPELKRAEKRLKERASAAAKAAAEIRKQTLSKGALRKVADAVGSKPAATLLERLRENAEAEGKEADAAAGAQAEAVKQLEGDIEELVDFLDE